MTLQSMLHLQTNRDGVISRRTFLRNVAATGAAAGVLSWKDAVVLHRFTHIEATRYSRGSDVMYEHSETWNWATGESAVLQFVSVHRVDCSNAANISAMAESGESRLIEVEWDRESPGVFMVSIENL